MLLISSGDTQIKKEFWKWSVGDISSLDSVGGGARFSPMKLLSDVLKTKKLNFPTVKKYEQMTCVNKNTSMSPHRLYRLVIWWEKSFVSKHNK